MTAVSWHQVAKLFTISILENLGLYNSLSLYRTIIVLYSDVNPLFHIKV